MRSLSSSLLAAQKASTIDALAKIELSYGASSYTYDRERILDNEHPEETYNYRAEVMLDNSDGALTNLDLKGFKGVISKGAKTSVGDEYSPTAPLWVIDQRLESSQGRLVCILSLVGIPNLLAEDEASESYIPDEDDDKTVKTLINEILGATLDCYDHCQAYEVVWDAGYDSLANTYKPKDGFRIYVGGSRLAAFRRLMDYTGNVPRFEADGKIHILKPVTTGTSYDYQYSLDAGHTFFSKAYRKRLVIPNYVVVESHPDDDPYYKGWAKDTESYNLMPKRQYKQMRLESDDQAEDIAEALLSKYQLQAEMGAADVPMNVGAELFDYVKVTDSRESDYRVGNIGYLARHYNPGRGSAATVWHLTFSFGNWFSALETRRILRELEIYTDEGQYLNRLTVKDGYIENLLITNIDAVWLDPDGNIDLSQIGDDLDSLPDGDVYARVKSLHLDAGQIKLDEHIFYKAGFNPTDKFDLGDNDLDDIPEGAIYRRVKSAALTAGGLVILDNVYINYSYGQYALVNRTDIQAGSILLSSVVQSSYYRTVSDAQKGIWSNKADLDDIPANLDELPDGYTYKRILHTQISAGRIYLSDACIYASGFDPSTKWEGEDLDDLPDGTIYKRLLATQIEAGKIRLSDKCVFAAGYDPSTKWTGSDLDDLPDGSIYGRIKKTDIYAGHIKLWTCEGDLGDIDGDLGDIDGDLDDIVDGSTYAKLKETDISAGHIKLTSYVRVSGEWYNEGYIEIDADVGIIIGGQDLIFEKYGDEHFIYPSSVGLCYFSDENHNFYGWDIESSMDIMPHLADVYDLGSSSKYWENIYTEDIYREYEKDLQHLDDIGLIRQMKGDKKRPGFIDKTTIPSILLETKEHYLAKLQRRLDGQEQEMRGILEEAIAGETRPKKRAKLQASLAKVGKKRQERLQKAEQEFTPMISMATEISLVLGAIRQIADNLEGMEARLNTLESK